jgi:three-Cys-motif partner protein
MPELLASDGLRARDNGLWGKIKLSFLDFYCPTALFITRNLPGQYYLDLFAGPGINKDARLTGEEFEGSPLRTLKLRAQRAPRTPFARAIFVNKNRRDHRALRQRIHTLYENAANSSSLMPYENIETILGNANEKLPEIMSRIPRRAYVLAFADITRPKHWPWSSVCALTGGGHRSVDFYMLFPVDMAVLRLAAYDRAHRSRWAPIVSSFFGTSRAVEIMDALRNTDEQASELRRRLVELYISQLRTRWQYADSVLAVKRRGDHLLYEMVFASNSPHADDLRRWAQRQMRELQDQGQVSLQLR